MLGDKEQGKSELLSFLNILFHPSISSDERLNRLQAQGFPVEQDFREGVIEMTREELRVYSAHDKRIREEERILTLWPLVQDKSLTLEKAASSLKMTTQSFLEKVKEILGAVPQ